MAKHAMTRREFLGITLGTAGLSAVSWSAWAARPAGGRQAQNCPEYVARLKVRHASRFRILQFTDLHFFSGKDPNFGLMNPATVKDMTQLVKRAKPDLLMITGDLWRDSPEPRRDEFMRFAVAQCEALGVPWAFTWGNHDQLNDFKAGHEAFTKAKHSLYRAPPRTETA